MSGGCTQKDFKIVFDGVTNISLFAKTYSDWLKLKTCPQGRGLGALNGGAFEQPLALGGGNFNNLISKSSNAWGFAGRGLGRMLKF